MGYRLIANGQAGRGAGHRDDWRQHLADAGITHLTVHGFDEPWDAAIEPGDRVLVAGGDGSVNRAAQACLARDATLGVLPSGTANDFARNLNLPAGPAALCRLIAAEPARRFDVAWLNDRLFLNVVHIGLGTLPATQASPRLKRYLGRFSYLAVLLRQLGLRRGFKARLHHANGELSGRWLSIAVASGAFFGGGQRIPGASPLDGQLTLVAVRPRPWWQLLRAFATARLRGAPPPHDDSVVTLTLPACRISLAHPHSITADGEALGRHRELTLRAVPAALAVIAAPGRATDHD